MIYFFINITKNVSSTTVTNDNSINLLLKKTFENYISVKKSKRLTRKSK